MKPTVLFPKIILTLGLCFFSLSASATHWMGADITYECISNCIYRIKVSLYYDCTSGLSNAPLPTTNPPPAPNIGLTGIPNFPGQLCNAPTPVGGWQFVSYTEVTPVCPTTSTNCTVTNAPLRGVAELVYYQDYDFCSTNCDQYTISWTSCCRNNAITSLTNPGGLSLYTGSTIINTGLTPCNSSPQFANPPVPYLCEGQTYTFNQGAFDPDGDSLVYSLGPCFSGAGTTVPYVAGFSPTQPLGPGWNTTINSLTGDITVTPTPPTNGPSVVAVMCVYVEEYRNGVKIGEVFRDIQMTVINCAIFGGITNVPPTIDSLTVVSPQGSSSGLTVTSCACEEICFDISTFDPDLGQNYILYWDAALPGTFANSANPFVPVDTVYSAGPGMLPTGQFCWVPTETGLHQFRVTIQDDGCPLLGQNQYTIVMNVTSCSLDPYVSTTVVGCYDVQFDGLPCGGAPPFVYSWSGAGGLTGSSPTFTHSYPGPGNYPYTLTISDSTGVSSSTTGTISLSNTSVADGGPDITICPNTVGTIGTPPVPGYTYQWSSPTGLGWSGTPNPATAQATVAFNNTTNNTIPLNFVLGATDPNGCTDYDTVTVNFAGKPLASFGATAAVCVNDVASIVFTAPPKPGATYNWTYDGGTGTSIGPGPHQVSWSTPGVKTVTLWVEENGCRSDTISQQVLVNSIPTSTFTASTPVCAGQPALINYTGTGSPSATFIWDFDGGVGGGGAGPFGVSWVTPGTKTITLNVDQNGCLSPAFTQTVDVFPVPTSDFNIAATACEGEQVQIVYTGSGTLGASYAWSFDGGQIISGTGQGPFIVEWPNGGPKNVCLQVEENGCISPLTCETLNVIPTPVASIAPVANQCFTGNSFNFSYTGDPATSWSWVFGADAVPAVSTAGNPGAVNYLNTGVKTVYLIVTKDGCVSDTAFQTFEVVPEPDANFSASTNGSCVDSCVTFVATGTSLGPTQSYFWDFGTGAIPPSTTLQNPPCVDFFNVGSQSVSLTVSYKGCVVTTTQQINVSGSPLVSAGADVEFCEGDGGAQIDASVSGGTAPYFYSWWCDDPGNCGLSSNSIEDPIANPNNPSAPHDVTYFFLVNDVNGCMSNLDSVRVRVKAKPLMNAGPDLFLCEEGLGDFLQGGVATGNNASLPISYQWTPALGINDPTIPNPYARPTITSIYTLVGTSANGCTSDVNTLDPLSTVTVHVNALPVASAGLDTGLCVGAQITLQGFASGAGPNYTYQWTPATPGTISNPNSPTPTVTPNQTTTFTLVVESNGCFSEGDQVEVVVDTKPTANAGNNESLCLNDSVALQGSSDGDPNATFYQYSWSPATGLSDPNIAQPNASPSVTTTYTLVATSNFGCGSDQATMTVTIKPTPEVEALSRDTLLCFGEKITLSATHSWTTAPSGPVVYTWTPENSIIGSPYLADVVVQPTQTTLYTVKASVASDDCPTTDQVLVTVTPEVTAKISVDTIQFCRGDFVQLQGFGGLGNANFTWSPAAGLSDAAIFNPMASPDTSITYELIVAEGMCADTSTIALIVNETPVADYFTSLPNGCAPLTISFLENSVGGTGFEWDFGDGTGIFNGPNPSHTFDQPGEYVVTMTALGPGGCSDMVSTTTVSVSENVTADFSADLEVEGELALPNALMTFTDLSVNATSWYWNFGDGEMSEQQNPTHAYTQAGSYTVSLTATDENGCVQTVEYGPYHVVIPDVLIPNVFTPNGDGINDEFQVKYNGSETFRVKIFDRWGRPFFEADAPDKTWNGMTAAGANAQEGVYFYSIQIGENSFQGNITLVR